MANQTNKKQPGFYYYLQESKSYLALRLIALELVIVLVAVVVNVGFASVPQLDDRFFLAAGLSLAHLLVQLVNAALILLLIIAWLHRVYIITPQEVVVLNGVVAVGRTVFNAEKIESINVRQSVVGSLLNYGTITFFSSALKEEVQLNNIPDPVKYASVLEQSRIGTNPPNIAR